MKNRAGYRELKKKIQGWLRHDDFQPAMDQIVAIPARKVINPLVSLLCSPEQVVQKRAIEAIGIVVAQFAKTNLESARDMMRRLMWYLNEESGGIGWGVPEAMASVLIRHPQLAEEYHKILLSYSDPASGSYLEDENLQACVTTAVKRLAKERPDLVDQSYYKI